MKKVIKITESELVRIINRVLTEMPMGVPDNMTETASEIYNAILVKLSEINSESQDESFQTIINGDFRIDDYEFDTVNLEINAKKYTDEVGFQPQIARAAIRGKAKVEGTRVIREVPKELDILYDIAVGTNWNFGMIVDLFKTERPRYEASLAHELMHAFDHFKKPDMPLSANAKYEAVQSAFMNGMDPINHFNHLMYFVHQTEQVTRATELYSYLRSDKITKENFKEYFLNHEMIKTLKDCRDFTFSKLVSDMGDHMDEVNKFIEYVRTHDTGYPHEVGPDLTDIQKIHVALDFAHKMVVERKIDFFHQGLQTSVPPFLPFMPPQLQELIVNEKQEYLDKFIKEARKHKNYRNFFEYEIKKLNFAGNKIIKKLSKLYDMVKSEDKSIVNWDLHHKINKTSEKSMKKINELFKDEPVKFDPNKKKD